MEFTILGPTQMLVDHRPVPLGAPKQRQLLTWLLYRVGEPVRADLLAEQLWPQRPWPDTKTVLHQHISRVRAVLADAGVPGVLAAVGAGGYYRLDVDAALVDYHRFVRLARQARSRAGDHPSDAAELLVRALALWQGDPLAELDTDAAERIRTQLTDTLWLPACQLLADCYLAAGDSQAAQDRLEPLLLRYESDQAIAARWMSALIAGHRARDAVSFFAQYRDRLARDGDQPSADLVVLYHTAQQHATQHRIVRASIGRDDHDRPKPLQLPRDLHDFTGRQDILRELDRLVSQGPAAPVIAIDGMPAVGKSAVAIRWANRHRDRFTDGQLFIDARGYGPGTPLAPTEILGRFLRAFGVAAEKIPPAEPDRADLFNQILAHRKVLILIDNVRDHTQVQPLLTTSPGCLIMATSRTRLSALALTAGAHCLTVPPLETADRTKLLVDRLGRRADEDREALAELSRLTGGLPMAVRIAAEHIRVRPDTSLADLVEELRPRLVTDTASTTSLYTVFSWSYHALDTDCRTLFRRFGLTPISIISKQAAAALLAADTDHSEQILNRLTTAHLLSHAPHHRYQIHDLLHQFAAHLAETDDTVAEQHDALHRLLDWLLLTANNAATALAPERTQVPNLPTSSNPPPQCFDDDTDALLWAQQERDTVMALTHHAARHGFHMHAWQLPNTMHEIYDRYDRQEDILAGLETALDSARKTGIDIAIIGTLNNVGTVCFAVHDYARGAAYFEQALHLARRNNSLEAQAVCSHNLARFRLEIGNVADAIALYHDALELFRSIDDVRGESFSLHRLGEAYWRFQQYDSALSCYQQALQIRERIGFVRGQAATHSQLAGLRLELGQTDLAAAHCEQALMIADRAHDDAITCDTLLTRARLHSRMNQPAEAAQDAEAAHRLALGLADPQRQARAREMIITLDQPSAIADPRVGRFDQRSDPADAWPTNRSSARRHHTAVDTKQQQGEQSMRTAPQSIDRN